MKFGPYASRAEADAARDSLGEMRPRRDPRRGTLTVPGIAGSGAVCLAAALLPLAVFRHTAVAPATRLVAALPSANPLDDPAMNATAIARAWARWERGDFRIATTRLRPRTERSRDAGNGFPRRPSSAIRSTRSRDRSRPA